MQTKDVQRKKKKGYLSISFFFGSDEICVLIKRNKKNPRAHLFVCVVQPEVALIPRQARGSDLSLHVALKSVLGGNTAACSPLTAFCASNTPA